MILHVQFEQGHPRDIPVSKQTTITVEEAGEVFSLDGLTAMFLVSDTGDTMIEGEHSAEAAARAIGWASADEVQALRDEIGDLTFRLGQQREIIGEFERLYARDTPVTSQSGGAEAERLAAAGREREIAAAENEAEVSGGEDAAFADDDDELTAA